jgi:hypothetical protein
MAEPLHGGAIVKTHADFRQDGPAFLAGELDPERRERMASHLKECPDCRLELEDIRKAIDAAGLVRGDLEKAMASVDWDALPSRIADYVLTRESRESRLSPAGRVRAWLARTRMRPVYAGVGLGLILGVMSTYLLLRKPGSPDGRGGRYYASAQFLDRVEVEMAKRDTLDYLDRSHYLLLDFVQASDEAGGAPDILSGERARDLLTRKKYLNPQLERGRMATAKAICDQIDLLFLELSQITKGMAPGELRKIQDMIRESQLLLKISLVRKELETGV